MATKIYTIQDLQNMDNDLAGEYELANDIDAAATEGWNAGAGFVPVGTSANPFTGSFDGKGYTITGLFISRQGESRIGLFGQIREAAIQNVTLANVDIRGDLYVGALVGEAWYTLVTAAANQVINCSSSGSVHGMSYGAGGLIGRWTGNTLQDCHSSCNVFGGVSAGGLVGLLYNYNNVSSIVEDCSATGTVQTASWGYAGGFAALIRYDYNANNILRRCWADCAISVADDAFAETLGGFAKEITSAGGVDNFVIEQCYALGSILSAGGDSGGGAVLGGFAGNHWVGTVKNCYSRTSITVTTASDFTVGGFAAITQDSTVIENCHAAQQLTMNGGTYRIGGFVGYNYPPAASVTNCFWDTETSGIATSDGGTGKTTAEMKQEQTFLDASWDLDDIWGVSVSINDGYPELQWVEPPIIPPIPPDPLPPVRLKITPYTLPYRSLKIYTGRRI